MSDRVDQLPFHGLIHPPTPSAASCFHTRLKGEKPPRIARIIQIIQP